MLRSVMHGLERRLHARDFAERRVQSFAWGLEFLGNGHGADDPRRFIKQFNKAALADSARFYTPPPSRTDDFDLAANGAAYSWLCYPSGVVTPYEKNNLVHARFFPALTKGAHDRAVIVAPQWNAQEDSHVALCRALNRCGIAALRLSLPYHDRRRLDGFTRADFMVSANIGRTIQAVQQAVHDIRRGADWLTAQGYEKVGVMGSSIGSCMAWLAFIHDERLAAGVFNMVSSWFGDVVWRALTTAHIRQALATELTAEEVREAWRAISPSALAHRLSNVRRPALLISARYDLTFLPDLSQIFFDDCARHGVPATTKLLACGHYTIGRTPFKYVDGWHIVNFFRRAWR
jgi:dienelactone hydrolase